MLNILKRLTLGIDEALPFVPPTIVSGVAHIMCLTSVVALPNDIICSQFRIGDIVYLKNRKVKIIGIQANLNNTYYILNTKQKVLSSQLSTTPITLSEDVIINKIEYLESLPTVPEPTSTTYTCPASASGLDLNALKNRILNQLERLEDS